MGKEILISVFGQSETDTLLKAHTKGKEQIIVAGVISHLPCNLAMGTDFPLTAMAPWEVGSEEDELEKLEWADMNPQDHPEFRG